MKEKFENCNPSVVNNDLMSWSNVYITNEIIQEQCNCAKRRICTEILRLLKKWERQWAIDLIDNK